MLLYLFPLTGIKETTVEVFRVTTCEVHPDSTLAVRSHLGRAVNQFPASLLGGILHE